MNIQLKFNNIILTADFPGEVGATPAIIEETELICDSPIMFVAEIAKSYSIPELKYGTV